MENYKIAIPSYGRSKTLIKATLQMLANNGTDFKRVYIFVANEEECDIYEKALNGPIDPHGVLGYGPYLIIGKKGIKNQRNFMSKFFDDGEYIFYLDDDVYNIFKCVHKKELVDKKLVDKGLEDTPANRKKWHKSGNILENYNKLHEFIINGFKKCEESGFKLFGLHPVENAYFLRPDHVSTDLRYIIGYACGVINDKECEIRTVDDKEDYERSIKYYLKYGGVLRYNGMCVHTNCYKEPGGMQSEGHRSWERVDESAKYLANKYPFCAHLNIKKKKKDKKTGKPWTELRLKDKRKVKSFSGCSFAIGSSSACCWEDEDFVWCKHCKKNVKKK